MTNNEPMTRQIEVPAMPHVLQREARMRLLNAELGLNGALLLSLALICAVGSSWLVSLLAISAMSSWLVLLHRAKA